MADRHDSPFPSGRADAITVPSVSNPYAADQMVPQGVDVGVDAHAAAQVEIIRARCVMALQRPRNVELVRQRIMAVCKRPAFAKVGVGLYRVTGKGSGLSIRFAEEAMQCMGNMHASTNVLREDVRYRYLLLAVTDLETNNTLDAVVAVPKTIERKDPKGREVISSRRNSNGEVTHQVAATEDELLNLQANLCSKALRGLVLRLVPADVKEEAEQTMWEVSRTRDAADPVAARRSVLDAFVCLGVPADQVDAFLGKPVGQASPVELDRLRAVWSAVQDGADWRELLEARREELGAAGKADQASGDSQADPSLAGALNRLKGRPQAQPAAKATGTAPSARPESEDDEPAPEAPGDVVPPHGPGQQQELPASGVDRAPKDPPKDPPKDTTGHPRGPVVDAPPPTPKLPQGRIELPDGTVGFTDDDDGLAAAAAITWVHGRTYKGQTVQQIIDSDDGLRFLLRSASTTRLAEEHPDLWLAANRVVGDPLFQTDMEALGSGE